MRRELAAVLLDVDGTILDTREFILSAMEHALSSAGLPVLARAELAAQVGRPLEEIYAGWSIEPAPLIESHRSFQAGHLHLAAAFPGAAETLGQLVRAGLRLGAVTSRSRRTSVRTLELAGLAPFFDIVVSAEDAEALKPDPAPLLLALREIGGVPARAAMVGDTRHDVEAGKALGMRTVGASYGFAGASIREAGPDVIITDIRGLPGALGVVPFGTLSSPFALPPGYVVDAPPGHH